MKNTQACLANRRGRTSLNCETAPNKALELAEHLAIIPGGCPLESGQVDVLTDELDRAIPHEALHPADVRREHTIIRPIIIADTGEQSSTDRLHGIGGITQRRQVETPLGSDFAQPVGPHHPAVIVGDLDLATGGILGEV